MEVIFKERLTVLQDWATILFLIAFILIAINRTIYSTRFYEFSNLAFSNKYVKIYKDSSNLKSSFTITMFAVQLISFSFFLHLFLTSLKNYEKTNGIIFIQIFTFLTVFILSKYLVEKIISSTFNIEEFTDQFNLYKVSYRTYFGFLLLPINMILYYNSITSLWIYTLLAILIFVFNILSYIITLRIYQNLLSRKIFYFILYLCTLEIAPYYFIYYWVSNK